MADQVFELVGDLRLKLHDNGDGSYSLVTYGNGGAAAALAAGENHIGQVGGHTRISTITMTPDTSAVVAGDILADTQTFTAFRKSDNTGVLQSLVIQDKDDQTAAAMDIYILDTNVSLGTENSPPSVSDANAEGVLGIIAIEATDWKDYGSGKIATKRGIGLPVKSISGLATLGIAIVAQGTPTQSASSIIIRVGILED